MTRFRRLTLLSLAIAGASIRPAGGQSAPGASPTAPHRSPAIESIGVTMVGITVADLDRSVGFYRSVLGFVPLTETEVAGEAYERLTGVFGARLRVARLRLGSEVVELTQYLAPEGRPLPVDSRSNDRWFQHDAIVVRDIDSAYRVLRAHRVRHASTGPQRLPDSNPEAGGIRAFYFKDPDGHYLELIWFPAGKGDPRWQQPTGPLFLGIDHTAIVVNDTETSLRFYRDLLGFRVAGESRNFGTEQEHLNNVEHASLRITGLRLASGPGVELLQYLRPTGGRAYPADARPNDLVHWQTVLATRSRDGLGRLAKAGVPVVSTAVAALPDTMLGYRRGVMVRDPDGHAVLLVDR
jgi:catechol 2,3-dioxygenase-like lactoylglutathione lyase family enzyme